MCGIIGYTGDGSILERLLEGLSNLEYRGYDSAGVAVATDPLSVEKREGELSNLAITLAEDRGQNDTGAGADESPDADGFEPLEVAADATGFDGPAGIGHTRWSTHGPPTDANAHPHVAGDGTVAVVHNGIIENYRVLRDELTAAGVEFRSETDTEVVPHLIERERRDGAERETAFRRAIDRLEGSYAIAAVFAGCETIFGARRESPLVVGFGDGGTYLASDVPAFLERTNRVSYLDDGEFVACSPSSVTVTDAAGTEVEKPVETVDWDPDAAGKSGYDHYMRKEIAEQPRAIRDCLRGRVTELEGTVSLPELEGLETPSSVQFVACGTSYHAGLFGERLLRRRGIHAQTFVASEYDAAEVPIDDGTLVVGITQSGETADTMRALRGAGRAGATTLALTNVVASSAARECDRVLYIRAGPEISVAATKSFASQQVTLSLLANALADTTSRAHLRELRRLPEYVQSVLDDTGTREVAEALADADAYFFIGRGDNAPVALEGALKLKEISYEHAEGFPAGELKHGPLALVTPNTPVFAIVSGRSKTAETIGNVNEVRARGAPVVAVTDDPESVAPHTEYVLEIPETRPSVVPIVANVQLQLVAYWLANALDRPIDRPRNLAKSVTVL
ncbi:glutamine--fructose-6-phosphate transaminase (isomerizing) [Natrarchaeobaculum aegyptiacum]|uniref:Glutamine--fructose-6-phosphate aminotransferase [isomerizing] n=1 Tax=Natrarchaeobaculum aegyptiacum TaxID=745377 RepID=A0A2Z2HRA6_9EURY|nr:glutamine--fructose-6-phosphate transaminase (isomerizing) [Natrarchaeobaculum aegyptiacum]ARS89680.1 glutamine--fructose-6-phosphate transaminase (isomerizing) [Natrarchaeobaculum aegyptiacum]